MKEELYVSENSEGNDSICKGMSDGVPCGGQHRKGIGTKWLSTAAGGGALADSARRKLLCDKKRFEYNRVCRWDKAFGFLFQDRGVTQRFSDV